MALTPYSRKIVNDPVHGFITIPGGLPRRILEHQFFQRLRHIRQLGLSDLVYPGATHTRFQHALGAMHLMQQAINALRLKGQSISPENETAALAAILLHDIGHGPFSHCLEGLLLPGYSHERLSLALMQRINSETQGALDETIDIFTNRHREPFLHQLVSGQLDTDRLDYLLRDSFYTGVVEGRVPSERLLKMMQVRDGKLVIEVKGIYSVESFLLARRVMYWQVYLHKTVVTAEKLLQALLARARYLAAQGNTPECSNNLQQLLALPTGYKPSSNPEDNTLLLDHFLALDDSDILTAIKSWCYGHDATLSHLAQRLRSRNLPRLTFTNEPLDTNTLLELRDAYRMQNPDTPPELVETLIQSGQAYNQAYNSHDAPLQLVTPQGDLLNLTDISRVLTPDFLQKQDTRPYFLVPKEFYSAAKAIMQ